MSGALKEVRERIKSVNSTQQITKAMKMVSAAKLRRAQMAITEMRPYAERLDNMLRNILSNMEGGSGSSFGVARQVEKALVIVVTSNRGLAGAFNSNIIKAAVAKIEGEYSAIRKAGGLTILSVGKKGADYFRKRYQDCELITDHTLLFEDLSFENVAQVSQLAMDGFILGDYDQVVVSYGRFKNAGVQIPQCVQFLPVTKIESSESEDEEKKHKADYLFEPSKEELLEELIPTILQTTFQKFVLDTHASEHGARMTAMDSATENANEMLKDLKVSYNKARQEAITKELSEIVGGAAAFEG